jgi:hypothetical protein
MSLETQKPQGMTPEAMKGGTHHWIDEDAFNI